MIWFQLSKQRSLYYGMQTVNRNVITRISINDVGPTNCRHERSNPDIEANIEGLKLDILILQKQIEERLCLQQMPKIKTLLSSVSEKDNAITEETCLTFESLVLTLEQKNDFPRIPLTIIMQEKSEADNNQSRSREC